MNGKILCINVALALQDTLLYNMVLEDDHYDSRSTCKIIVALNDALSEISHMFPVFLKKTVETSDGDIANEDICNSKVFTVTRVTACGKDVPFKVDSLGVHVGGKGTFTVFYTPEVFDTEWETDIDFSLSPEVGTMMMTHLIARNYCLLSGRTEEAALFDSRYRDYVESRTLKRRAHIPARKFV